MRHDEYDMTPKQRRIADEYLIDLNGTQAAIRCGYKAKNARAIGAKMLAIHSVRKYIENVQQNITNSRIATAEEVQIKLTSAMRGELTEDTIVLVPNGKGGLDTEIRKKGLAGREVIKAAELMARRHGLLTDNIKQEITGTIIIDGMDDANSP